jgi:hypothetical protein
MRTRKDEKADDMLNGLFRIMAAVDGQKVPSLRVQLYFAMKGQISGR